MRGTFDLVDDSTLTELFADLVDVRRRFKVLFEAISKDVFEISFPIYLDQRSVVVNFIQKSSLILILLSLLSCPLISVHSRLKTGGFGSSRSKYAF